MMNKYIEPILYFYLTDRTYSVRERALGKLKNLVQTYKMEWVNSSLLPKLVEATSKENGYLIRITALYSLQVDIFDSYISIYLYYADYISFGKC